MGLLFLIIFYEPILGYTVWVHLDLDQGMKEELHCRKTIATHRDF